MSNSNPNLTPQQQQIVQKNLKKQAVLKKTLLQNSIPSSSIKFAQ
jgi:hypothetical protein